MRAIKNNRQDNNNDFMGKFKGSVQCMSTSAWMLMSWYTDKYDATDDCSLAMYADDVNDEIGQAGIGEIIKRKFKWMTGNTAYYWEVHKSAIEKWLWKVGVKGQCVYNENATFDSLIAILYDFPAMLGTSKLGGLPGGHVIVALYVDGDYVVCNDPYGDANTNYRDKNGENVRYSIAMLREHFGHYLYFNFNKQ
jgi:hypothetical protein